MSEQCQHNVSVPSLPLTYLELIQTAHAFGCFKADLDFPPVASDIGQCLQCGQTTRYIDNEVCTLTLFIDIARRQQVVASADVKLTQLCEKQDRRMYQIRGDILGVRYRAREADVYFECAQHWHVR